MFKHFLASRTVSALDLAQFELQHIKKKMILLGELNRYRSQTQPGLSFRLDKRQQTRGLH